MGSKSSVGERSCDRNGIRIGSIQTVIELCRIIGLAVLIQEKMETGVEVVANECVEMGTDSCTVTLTTRVRYTIYSTEFLTQRYNNTIQINARLEYEYGEIKYKSNDEEKMK